MLTKDDIVEIMKNVRDPELRIDLWTLGLIYDIQVNGTTADIKMTFTSPMCPFGPQLVDEVKTQLQKKGFKEQNIEVVFEPPWVPSEEVREMLGV